jgi:hypothetical protein
MKMERRKQISVMELLASRLFDAPVIAISITFGVLLIWIGTLVGTLGGSGTAANVLMRTGVALMSAMLIGGGIANPGIDRIVRAVAIIMSVLMILALIGIRYF